MMSKDLSLDAWLTEWVALLKREGVGAGEGGIAVGKQLWAAYTEEGRYYHSAQHIWDLLAGLERFKAYVDDEGLVALAIWFHDVVYNPWAQDNEARSAEYARDSLVELGVEQTRAERVATLILATSGHVATEDTDCQLFLDLDLMGLGAEPSVYQKQSEDIRREYQMVPEPLYRAGRRHILEEFIKRERLYYTPPLYELYESQARLNLQQEIEELTN
ncbi:MAG TPA: N-methyl-D-aspartate receptor NMDAR2C subunit [Anaerolineae bacterium]|nr:N-methyl-D-aspartate receptor NMDAR2C subunit [Anaerolineae bacterium]